MAAARARQDVLTKPPGSLGRLEELSVRLAGIQDCFDEIVSRDDVARAKPAPDLFLEAARRLNNAPGASLVLEDSAIGIRAARRAGTIPVLITDQPRVAEEAGQPQLVLPSLLAVVELLESDPRQP